MFIVCENKYIYDNGEIKQRGWEDIAMFESLEEAKRFYRRFCYGSPWSDYRIDRISRE